jgi:hypothetical protein
MNVVKLLKKLARRRGDARINGEAQMRHAERAIVRRRVNTATLQREPLLERESRYEE